MKREEKKLKIELTNLREQLISSKTSRKTDSIGACKLFRFLSGKSVLAFANSINVSHTYWTDLENGRRLSPSDEVRMNIANTLGLSYETVEYLLDDENTNFDEMYAFIIEAIEKRVTEKRLQSEQDCPTLGKRKK